MKNYLKGTKVTQKVDAEYLQTIWKCDGMIIDPLDIL